MPASVLGLGRLHCKLGWTKNNSRFDLSLLELTKDEQLDYYSNCVSICGTDKKSSIIEQQIIYLTVIVELRLSRAA